MNPDTTIRRRVTFACLLTLIALPTVWLLNRSSDDGGAASTAATQQQERRSHTTEADAAEGEGDDAGDETITTTEPLSLDESIYLSGDGTEQPDVVVDVAVPPAPDGEVVSARATFSSNFNASELCVGGPGEFGTVLTVTNVNNNRSAECTVVSGNGIINPEPGTVVLDRSTYLEIADASDAPVPVEIRR